MLGVDEIAFQCQERKLIVYKVKKKMNELLCCPLKLYSIILFLI